jgi:hypothetical protein
MGPTIAACIPECQTCRRFPAEWLFEGVKTGFRGESQAGGISGPLKMATAWMRRPFILMNQNSSVPPNKEGRIQPFRRLSVRI